MKHTAENTKVILYFSYKDQIPITLVKDEVKHTNKGMIIHNTLINQPFGKEFSVKDNKFYLLPESKFTRVEFDKRRTQIIFEPDTAIILSYLNLKRADSIIECGTGSGVLTHSLSESVPDGMVYTYEVDEERYLAAKEKFSSIKNITTILKDANLHGFEQNEIDAVFLDLGSPYNAIKYAHSSLKNGGNLCVFVPSFNQVSLSLSIMNELYCNVRMFECIIKKYNKSTNKNDIYLIDDLYYHTGYLIFGTK